MKIEVSEGEAYAFWAQIKEALFQARLAGKKEGNPLIEVPVRMGPDGMTLLASAFAEVKAGQKIEAIKRVREAIGCGLKEAKDVVEGTFRGTT